MAGPILSDSTPFLSSHERPTSYRNSPSSNSAYFPSTSAHQSYNHSSSSYYQHHQQQHHFTHPDNIHVHPSKRPLSPGTSVPSPAPSFSPTQTHGLTQKPTLPGIASILAFASRQPAENNSSPYFRVSFPQSSDPVAHALPISVHVAGPSSSSITSTASTRNLSARDRKISAGETANNRHFTRRRRSSSTTIIDSDSYSSVSCLIDSKALCHPERHSTHSHSPYIGTPASDDTVPQLSSQSKTKSNNIGHLVHHPSSFTSTAQAAHRDQNIIEGNSAHSYSKISKTSPAPPLLGSDPLQRRHSDRISATYSKRSNHSSYHHSTSVKNLESQHQPAPSHSWASTAAPSHTGSEAIPRHVRRLSNASASSSSSASASLSSEFGASLSISSQAHIGLSSTQASSLSTSLNSNRSGSIDQKLWQRLDMMAGCSIEAGDRLEEQPIPQVRAQPQLSSPASGNRSQPNLMHVNPFGANQSQHRYQCLEVGCGKTFSRPSSLKIHSYSHTGQKPFKCMRCDRAFSVQSNLKRHQKVHERRGAGSGNTGGGGGGGGRTTMAHVLNHERISRGGAASGGGTIGGESGEEDEMSEVGYDDRMEE